MKRSRLGKVCVLVAVCGLLAALAVVAANAAMVRVGNIVVRADGGFRPQDLPRRTHAPIHFQGYVDISSVRGGPPPAVDYGILDFDRDGKLTTKGLAVCPPSRIESASPGAARRLCKGAIVGTGNLAASVALPGGRATVRSRLTIFNGPRQDGNATAILHAQAPAPVSETYVVVVPVEKRRGAYSYRATIDIPPIAGGAGALTHIDAKIGREYRFRGIERSYASARCSDGILETYGNFRFVDGTIVAGAVYKPCNPLP
jgi:hypothetical protein